MASRNGIAFGVVCVIVLTVAYFALTGRAPSILFAAITVMLGAMIGGKTWLTESRLAQEENALLLETHAERYRAYLHRRRIWSRLRYCSKCAKVVDPTTMQAASLFNVHELANSRQRGFNLEPGVSLQ